MSDEPNAVDVPHVHETPDDGHGNAYDGLLVNDSSHWAFGTDFEDPLAGVDTTVPDGVDPELLATYCLMLGDDALVSSHRLSRVVQPRARPRGGHRAGQHRARPARPGPAAAGPRGGRRPAPGAPAAHGPPGGSPVPPEDALAFFRDAAALPQRAARRGRQRRLRAHDRAAAAAQPGAARAARAARAEPRRRARGHRGQGRQGARLPPRPRRPLVRDPRAAAPRSRARASRPALAELWPLYPETLARHPVEDRAAEAGVGVAPDEVAAEVDVVLDQVLAAAGLERPDVAPMASVNGATGRDGTGTPRR